MSHALNCLRADASSRPLPGLENGIGMVEVSLSDAFDLALRHQRAGRHRVAATLCRALIAASAHHGPAIRLLGHIAAVEGDAAGAVEWLYRSLAVTPASASAYVHLGVLLRKLDAQEKAGACYRRALVLNPHNVDALVNLANIAQHAGKLDEAADALDAAGRLAPEDGAIFARHLALLERLGWKRIALSLCRRRVAAAPDDAPAWHRLAELSSACAHPVKAEAALTRVATLDPSHSGVMRRLARLAAYRGDLERARQLLAGCRATDPGEVHALDVLCAIEAEADAEADVAADLLRSWLDRQPSERPQAGRAWWRESDIVVRGGCVLSLDHYARLRNLHRGAYQGAPDSAYFQIETTDALWITSLNGILMPDDHLVVHDFGFSDTAFAWQIHVFDGFVLAAGRRRFLLMHAPWAVEAVAGRWHVCGHFDNFGHWLLNCAARIGYATETDRPPLLLNARTPDKRRALIRLAGYDESAARYLPDRRLTRIERAIVSVTLFREGRVGERSHYFLPAAARRLNAIAEGFPTPPGGGGTCVYLSRGSVGRRRVTNEDQVMEALGARGVRIVDPATLSIDEEIATLRKARIVVAPLGASACSLLFARPGTVLILLSVPDVPLNVMPEACAAIGISVFEVKCRPGGASGAVLFDDFTVPVDELTALLEQLGDQ